MKNRNILRKSLMFGTGLAGFVLTPTQTFAQTEPVEDNAGLEEIVVTAQKREQSLQDVPIAVTAINEASLEANRIVTVADLSGIAPNVTVRPAAGGLVRAVRAAAHPGGSRRVPEGTGPASPLPLVPTADGGAGAAGRLDRAVQRAREDHRLGRSQATSPRRRSSTVRSCGEVEAAIAASIVITPSRMSDTRCWSKVCIP